MTGGSGDRGAGKALGYPSGDVAQLVEHLLCKQGVGGSSPLVSTEKPLVRTPGGSMRSTAATLRPRDISERSRTQPTSPVDLSGCSFESRLPKGERHAGSLGQDQARHDRDDSRLWMTPRSWEHWKQRYEARGYTVHAPAWPGFEVEVEALNADPSPMNDLKAETAIDSYEAFIKGLGSDPIIIGHSLGGAMVQVLLNRGLGSVGIGLSAATVKGVRDLPFSTLKAAAPALNPFKRGEPVPMTEKEFHYAFANTMSEEESKPLWERYCVPAATGVLADIALANIHRNPPTEVDFAKQGRTPIAVHWPQ
jgi:alpha/beta hydrolase family protein